jgi:hypothetical protein
MQVLARCRAAAFETIPRVDVVTVNEAELAPLTERTFPTM